MSDAEVAFLALTGKIENHVRDRIAWSLHQTLSPLIVAREWRRRDLVILDQTGPRLLVEFKAMYSFDAVWPRKRLEYQGYIASDVEKMALPASPDKHLFEVVLSTHVGSAVGGELRGVVKYGLDANRALNQLGSNGLLDESRRQLRSLLGAWGSSEAIELARGDPWAIDTVVDAWLVGPIRPALAAEASDMTQI
jgi:hypothetical protein